MYLSRQRQFGSAQRIAPDLRGNQAWFQPVATLENYQLNPTVSINFVDSAGKGYCFHFKSLSPHLRWLYSSLQAMPVCFLTKFTFLPSVCLSSPLFSNPVPLPSLPPVHILNEKLTCHWENRCKLEDLHLFTIKSPSLPVSVHLFCIFPSFMVQEVSLPVKH